MGIFTDTEEEVRLGRMLKVQAEKVEPRLLGDSALMHCAALIIKDREIDPTMVRVESDGPDYGVDPPP